MATVIPVCVLLDGTHVAFPRKAAKRKARAEKVIQERKVVIIVVLKEGLLGIGVAIFGVHAQLPGGCSVETGAGVDDVGEHASSGSESTPTKFASVL